MKNTSIDIGNLLGEWNNVNRNMDYISRLQLSGLGDGKLLLGLFVARPTQGESIGEFGAVAFALPESSQAAGFCCQFAVHGMKTTIAANEKLGALVLQSYSESQGDSGQPARLTREFYRRSEVHASNHSRVESGSPATSQNSESSSMFESSFRRDDFSFLRGLWTNTFTQSSWVTRFDINNHQGNWTIRLFSRTSPDGIDSVGMVPFEFDFSEVGFSTRATTRKADSIYAAL